MKKPDLRLLLHRGWFRGHRALSDSEAGELAGPSPRAPPARPGSPVLQQLEKVLLGRPPRAAPRGSAGRTLDGGVTQSFTVLICNSGCNDEAYETVLAVWRFSSVQPLGLLLFIKCVDFL